MKHLEEHQIQGNRNDQDVLMYYTTTGSQPILQNSCFIQSFVQDLSYFTETRLALCEISF